MALKFLAIKPDLLKEFPYRIEIFLAPSIIDWEGNVKFLEKKHNFVLAPAILHIFVL